MTREMLGWSTSASLPTVLLWAVCIASRNDLFTATAKMVWNSGFTSISAIWSSVRPSAG